MTCKNNKKKDNDSGWLAKVNDSLAKEGYVEANKICKQTLLANPDNHRALVLSGIALSNLGQNEEALQQFKKAAKCKPNDSSILYNYGFALQNGGRYEEAIITYEQVLTINPACVNTLHNMGTIYYRNGLKEKAFNFYKKATSLSQNYMSYFNLGLIYCEEYQLKDALEMFNKALACNPNSSTAKTYIGKIYRLLGLGTQSIKFLEEAYALNQHSFEVCSELGHTYTKIGDYEKAEFYFEKAIPNDSLQEFTGKLNIALSKILLHQYDQAEKCLNHIVLQTPTQDLGQAEILLAAKLDISIKTCNWQDYEKNIADFKELFLTNVRKLEHTTISPFLSLSSIADPEHNYNVAVLYSKIFSAVSSQFTEENNCENAYVFENESGGIAEKRLKIGYVSADFKSHPCMHSIKGVVQNHDKNQFDIHFFDIGLEREHEEHEFLKKHGTFHQITPFGDFDAAKYISGQRIDILIDMMGHTRNSRLGIFSLRPAPIQISYLGCPGTTGTDFMDYIIGDKTVIPTAEEKYYSEDVLYLPQCYLPSNDQEVIADHIYTKQDFGINENYFVFCSFNKINKITPEIFCIWMEILQAVPNSVIMLSSAFTKREKFAVENLKKEALYHGVSSERLVFSERVPSRELHLARIKHVADVALDTTVYNGHSTTSEILWTGIPVVTIKGTNFPSRVSESILKELNMPELVTNSRDEYRVLAIKFANDPEFHKGIKEKILSNKKTSKFFNNKQYTESLEALYKKVWSDFIKTSST